MGLVLSRVRRVEAGPSRQRNWLAAGFLIVVTVTLTLYAPIMKGGFRLVDDYTHLQRAGNMPWS